MLSTLLIITSTGKKRKGKV